MAYRGGPSKRMPHTLTADDWADIWQKRADGASWRDIAEEYQMNSNSLWAASKRHAGGEQVILKGNNGNAPRPDNAVLTAVQRLTQKVDELATQVGGVDRKVGEVDAKADGVAAQVAAVDQKVETVGASVESVEDKVDDNHHYVMGRLDSHDTKFGGRVDKLNDTVGGLREKVGALQGAEKSADDARHTLRWKISTAVAILAAVVMAGFNIWHIASHRHDPPTPVVQDADSEEPPVIDVDE